MRQQFAPPRFGYGLQAVEELDRHLGGLGHLVNGVAVQRLVDLLLLPVGHGDQNLGQVLGSTELQGIAPHEAIGWLATHDVIDDVGGT